MLNNKLKELRLDRNLTQEAVAEYLGVTPQAVSKWERGLVSPDIMLLPRISALFRCSIDSIFNSEPVWGVKHRQEFESEIRELHAKEDWEGVYSAWMKEIELNPENYGYYTCVMKHVLRKKCLMTIMLSHCYG